MQNNCFYSRLFAVRQHRTEKNIAVVRVRDSMQTYIGDWHQLRQINDNDVPVIVFMHGAKVRCLWNSLQTIEQQHIKIIPSNNGSSLQNEIKEGEIRVQKINKLISFGIVQLTSVGTIITAMEPSDQRIYLSNFPPILKCLLEEPCTILEWSNRDRRLGYVILNNDGFESSNVAQNASVQTFCKTYVDAMKNLMQDCGKITHIAFFLCSNYKGDIFCSQIELKNEQTNKTIMLSNAYSSVLCKNYKIPTQNIITEECRGGLYEWFSLEEKIDQPCEILSNDNFNAVADCYNEDNQQLMKYLYVENRQKNMMLFSDLQTLESIKVIQSKCDEYCNRMRERICDGIQIQFRQLPRMVFCLPSLFFLLSQ